MFFTLLLKSVQLQRPSQDTGKGKNSTRNNSDLKLIEYEWQIVKNVAQTEIVIYTK